ncbi:MAG TPA: AmmeMemoRadiSam system protein B [Candidatus Andersenbacteria bacterium]|nr:AmmeMemoRadiSam system protein B [Candidatus Andersenbacteria bacterium]
MNRTWWKLLLSIISVGFFCTVGYESYAALTHKNAIIAAIIIPHHDIVAKQRKQFLNELGKKIQPKTIILISPNHYDVGKARIQTVDQDWNIAGGIIHSRSEVVQVLIKNGIGNEPASFPDEHGIHLVLGDIHQAFPSASLVPIIVKSSATQLDIDNLEQILEKTCTACLVVASVDFSHYQPALLGDVHDELTLRALQNLDDNALLHTAEVDSPGALLFVSKWARHANAEHFVTWMHTNSGELLQQPDIESTTHIFGYYESGLPAGLAGKKVVSQHSVTFLLGGDLMFGRMVAHTYLQRGMAHVFDMFGDRSFWGVDAGIANLEGPISKTPVPDDYNSKTLSFNFPPQTIDALKFLRINAASLANNHSANAGAQGVQDTRDLLKSANVQAIGGPGDQDIPHVGMFQGEKLRLIVIGVHALYGPPNISDLIKTYKADPNNRVMIFPHWGVEYAPVHNLYQAQLAHEWIDAGADIVIGSHPHVIQDAEVYKNKPIIYSLGNFVFDQNFSKETEEGLLVAGDFDDTGLSLFGLPIQIKNYQPIMMRGIQKKAILDTLYAPLTKFIQHTPLGDKLFFPL